MGKWATYRHRGRPTVFNAPPASNQWSLFIDEDNVFVVADDNGNGWQFYIYRWRVDGGAWVNLGPVGVGDTAGPLVTGPGFVEAQVAYSDNLGTQLSPWSDVKSVTAP